MSVKDKLFLAVFVLVVFVVGTILIYRFGDYARQEEIFALQNFFSVSRRHTPPVNQNNALPQEIANSDVFKAWLQKAGLEDGQFSAEPLKPLKYDSFKQVMFTSAEECKKQNLSYLPQVLINPDRNRSVCMGNFGEPDSYVLLFSNNQAEKGRLRFCGTPCGFDGGFWLDNDRFVLLENATNDGINRKYSFEVFDFKNKIQQQWKVEE